MNYNLSLIYMRTQLSVLIVLLLVIVLPASAQDVSKAISEGFIAQATALKDKDFAKSMEYTADELFTIAPKEQMLEFMKTSFSNPQMEIIMTVPEILSIGDPQKVEEKYFAIIESSSFQKLKFFDATGIAEAKDSPVVTQNKAGFENLFGAENVNYNEETGYFEIKVIQKSVAISKDGKAGWKYLAVDKSLYPILGQLLPQTIIDQVKS